MNDLVENKCSGATSPSMEVDFVVPSTTVKSGENINFTDLSSDSPNKWLWLFDEGLSSIDQNPTVKFNFQGQKTIELMAGNDTISGVNKKIDYITVDGDVDLDNFISATGITDSTIISALETLVTDLKLNYLWDRLIAIYPYVGGTSFTHKFNLKNPQDSDSAFRLSFLGGWTHNSNGIQGNGTNAYANTFIQPASHFIANNNSGGAYSRTNLITDARDFGIRDNVGGANAYQLIPRSLAITPNNFFGQINPVNVIAPNADSLGLHAMSIYAANRRRAYKNGNLIGLSNSFQPQGLASAGNNIFISATSTINSPSEYSSKNYAFHYFGEGFGDSDNILLYNAIQAFQTTLGRQI
jgi:PKD repeat protein